MKNINNVSKLFSRRPLLPIVIIYICGLISGKLFSIHLYILILTGIGLLICMCTPLEKAPDKVRGIPREPSLCVQGLGEANGGLMLPLRNNTVGGRSSLTGFVRNIFCKIFLFYCVIFLIGNLFYHLTLEYNLGPRVPIVREKMRNVIYYNTPDGEERNLLLGLFLGERQKVSRDLLDIMQNTNTIHILAISGDHIGFIGLIFVGMLRLMFVPRKFAVFIALIGVLLYVSMLGWQAPTFRAAVMFGVFAVGWILERPSDTINTLSFAAIVILLVTPQSLFQPGFQLSFVIVLGLLLLPPRNEYNYFKKLLWGSGVAWLTAFPLVAYHFQIISPISIIANLVMVSGISIVLAVGFMSILAGNIFIVLSGIFNAVNYYIIKCLIFSLKCFSEVPFGYFYVYTFSPYLIFLAYISIGILFLSRPFSEKPKDCCIDKY